jgi:hypothetical protein
MFGWFKNWKRGEVVSETTAVIMPEAPLRRLRVVLYNGRLEVRRYEGDTVQARVEVRVFGPHEAEAGHKGTDRYWEFRQSGGELMFQQQQFFQPFFRNGVVTVHVELLVPANLIELAGGPLQGYLKTHNGRVEVEGFTGDLEILTHNGTVNVRDVAGRVELTTHNGKVQVANIDGDLRADSYNGNVRIHGVTGAVRAETKRGDIEVDECQSTLRLHTYYGDIDAASQTPLAGHCDIRTKKGDIALRLPQDTQATLHMKTDAGKISGDALMARSSGFNHNIRQVLGNGEQLVDLKTNLGDIEVCYAR